MMEESNDIESPSLTVCGNRGTEKRNMNENQLSPIQALNLVERTTKKRYHVLKKPIFATEPPTFLYICKCDGVHPVQSDLLDTKILQNDENESLNRTSISTNLSILVESLEKHVYGVYGCKKSILEFLSSVEVDLPRLIQNISPPLKKGLYLFVQKISKICELQQYYVISWPGDTKEESKAIQEELFTCMMEIFNLRGDGIVFDDRIEHAGFSSSKVESVRFVDNRSSFLCPHTDSRLRKLKHFYYTSRCGGDESMDEFLLTHRFRFREKQIGREGYFRMAGRMKDPRISKLHLEYEQECKNLDKGTSDRALGASRHFLKRKDSDPYLRARFVEGVDRVIRRKILRGEIEPESSWKCEVCQSEDHCLLYLFLKARFCDGAREEYYTSLNKSAEWFIKELYEEKYPHNVYKKFLSLAEEVVRKKKSKLRERTHGQLVVAFKKYSFSDSEKQLTTVDRPWQAYDSGSLFKYYIEEPVVLHKLYINKCFRKKYVKREVYSYWGSKEEYETKFEAAPSSIEEVGMIQDSTRRKLLLFQTNMNDENHFRVTWDSRRSRIIVLVYRKRIEARAPNGHRLGGGEYELGVSCNGSIMEYHVVVPKDFVPLSADYDEKTKLLVFLMTSGSELFVQSNTFEPNKTSVEKIKFKGKHEMIELDKCWDENSVFFMNIIPGKERLLIVLKSGCVWGVGLQRRYNSSNEPSKLGSIESLESLEKLQILCVREYLLLIHYSVDRSKWIVKTWSVSHGGLRNSSTWEVQSSKHTQFSKYDLCKKDICPRLFWFDEDVRRFFSISMKVSERIGFELGVARTLTFGEQLGVVHCYVASNKLSDKALKEYKKLTSSYQEESSLLQPVQIVGVGKDMKEWKRYFNHPFLKKFQLWEITSAGFKMVGGRLSKSKEVDEILQLLLQTPSMFTDAALLVFVSLKYLLLGPVEEESCVVKVAFGKLFKRKSESTKFTLARRFIRSLKKYKREDVELLVDIIGKHAQSSSVKFCFLLLLLLIEQVHPLPSFSKVWKDMTPENIREFQSEFRSSTEDTYSIPTGCFVDSMVKMSNREDKLLLIRCYTCKDYNSVISSEKQKLEFVKACFPVEAEPDLDFSLVQECSRMIGDDEICDIYLQRFVQLQASEKLLTFCDGERTVNAIMRGLRKSANEDEEKNVACLEGLFAVLVQVKSMMDVFLVTLEKEFVERYELLKTHFTNAISRMLEWDQFVASFVSSSVEIEELESDAKFKMQNIKSINLDQLMQQCVSLSIVSNFVTSLEKSIQSEKVDTRRLFSKLRSLDSKFTCLEKSVSRLRKGRDHSMNIQFPIILFSLGVSKEISVVERFLRDVSGEIVPDNMQKLVDLFGDIDGRKSQLETEFERLVLGKKEMNNLFSDQEELEEDLPSKISVMESSFLRFSDHFKKISAVSDILLSEMKKFQTQLTEQNKVLVGFCTSEKKRISEYFQTLGGIVDGIQLPMIIKERFFSLRNVLLNLESRLCQFEKQSVQKLSRLVFVSSKVSGLVDHVLLKSRNMRNEEKSKFDRSVALLLRRENMGQLKKEVKEFKKKKIKKNLVKLSEIKTKLLILSDGGSDSEDSSDEELDVSELKKEQEELEKQKEVLGVQLAFMKRKVERLEREIFLHSSQTLDFVAGYFKRVANGKKRGEFENFLRKQGVFVQDRNLKDYSDLHLVQKNFGDVYLGYLKGDYFDDPKIIKVLDYTSRRQLEIQNEIKCLLRLKSHPTIIPVNCVFFFNQKKYPKIGFEMDYLKTDLLLWTKGYSFHNFNDQFLTEELRGQPHKQSRLSILRVFHKILEGVCFIHSKTIQHQDLKPQNILLNNEHDVRIIDFGIARNSQATFTSRYVGATMRYLSPEGHKKSTVGLCSKDYEARDMYAFGIMLLESLVPPEISEECVDLLGHFPFEEDTMWKTKFKLSVGESAFLKNLLNPDPKKRISAKEALKSDLFQFHIQRTFLSEEEFDLRKVIRKEVIGLVRKKLDLAFSKIRNHGGKNSFLIDRQILDKERNKRKLIIEPLLRNVVSQCKTPSELIMSLRISLYNESGIDLGGVTREVFSLLFEQVENELCDKIGPKKFCLPSDFQDHSRIFLNLGKLCFRCLLEKRNFRINFGPLFYSFVLFQQPEKMEEWIKYCKFYDGPHLISVEKFLFDKKIFQSLLDSETTFMTEERVEVPLKFANRNEYLFHSVLSKLKGEEFGINRIEKNIKAFRKGFFKFMPDELGLEIQNLLNPFELEYLVFGDRSFSYEVFLQNIEFDRNWENLDVLKNYFSLFFEDSEERRKVFIRYCCGSFDVVNGVLMRDRNPKRIVVRRVEKEHRIFAHDCGYTLELGKGFEDLRKEKMFFNLFDLVLKEYQISDMED